MMPPMLKRIILINVGICILINVLNAIKPGFREEVARILGQVPMDSWKMIWQHLTYMFVHFDPVHLFFNMIILYFFGRKLETQWGSQKFLTYYLICGVGAGVVHMLVSLAGVYLLDIRRINPYIPVVGASGAVFAIQLAYAAYWPDDIIYLIFPPIPLKAVHLIIGLIIFEVLMMPNYGDGISHLTHLTGILIGYLFLARSHREWNIRRWRWRRSFF